MAATFHSYSKQSFLWHLRDVVKRCGLRFLDIKEVSSTLPSTTGIGELVFSLPARRADADVLLYSSIDAATGRMRAKDSDRVRLVLRIHRGTEPPIHFHVGWCNRVERLFANVEKKYKTALDHLRAGTAVTSFRTIATMEDDAAEPQASEHSRD